MTIVCNAINLFIICFLLSIYHHCLCIYTHMNTQKYILTYIFLFKLYTVVYVILEAQSYLHMKWEKPMKIHIQ